MSFEDPDSWMWERAREFLERAEKVQRHFFQLRRARDYRPTWEPPVDIFEAEGDLWILVALPGVEAKDLDLTLDGRMLTVSAERTIPPQCHRAAVHRLEIPHGRFERTIELPSERYEVAAWEFSSGCLILSVKRTS